MPRGQRQPVGAEQVLQEVGLQALLEDREPGARTDVAAERDAHARRDVAPQREHPRAEGGVARRAVGHRGAPGRQHVELGVGRVHVVRQHRAATQQAVVVVGVDVVVPVRELVGDRGDLGVVLVDVGGEAGAVDRGEDVGARSEDRVGGREREARRDGVAEPAAAVPVPGQPDRLVVGALGRGEQRLGQHAVADHEPAGHPQPEPLGLGEEGVDRRARSGTRRPATSSSPRRRDRPRARRPPWRRTTSRRGAPPPAGRTARATRAAACRGHR